MQTDRFVKRVDRAILGVAVNGMLAVGQLDAQLMGASRLRTEF